MGILKVFDHEYKELKRFEKIVEEIDALEEEYKKLSDEELKGLIKDNPSGQGKELTPIILIREKK